MLRTPAKISGLVLWLDGADPSSLTVSGGSVSQWDDKSGFGNHVKQGALANQPTLANGALMFNGAQSLYTGTANSLPLGSSASTIFAVATPSTTPTTAPDVISWGTNDPDNFCLQIVVNNGSPAYAFVGTAPGPLWYYNKLTNTPSAGPHLISAPYAGGAISATNPPVVLDGGMVPYTTVAGTPNVSGSSLGIGASASGASNYWYGSISEVLIFTRALTTEERMVIEGYLGWKWGQPLTAGHPYQMAPPTDGVARAFPRNFGFRRPGQF